MTRLLSGGNPQVPKGHGDAPVRAWIDALPGWKGPPARRLDALIGREVPGVRRAVKWNSPLYGLDGETWFLSMHAFERYLKVAFHRGAALSPPPPVGSRQPLVRYLHLHEGDDPEAPAVAEWVRQASRLPGERM